LREDGETGGRHYSRNKGGSHFSLPFVFETLWGVPARWSRHGQKKFKGTGANSEWKAATRLFARL
jgi:hypothetical protein